MDEHLAKTLEHARKKLQEQEQAVIDTKKFINQVCQFAGRDPLYVIEDGTGQTLAAIRSDTFYGKSITTAVREFLEMRRASNLGAASHAEIITALKSGGFDFETISSDEAVAHRTIATTLGKNSGIFHRLPNGNWGLKGWYELKERKPKRGDVLETAELDIPSKTNGRAGQEKEPSDEVIQADVE
jgi:hypothetical protein